MRKINAPLSQLKKFAGKWVVIDPRAEKVIAVGDTIKDISALVVQLIPELLSPFFVPTWL